MRLMVVTQLSSDAEEHTALRFGAVVLARRLRVLCCRWAHKSACRMCAAQAEGGSVVDLFCDHRYTQGGWSYHEGDPSDERMARAGGAAQGGRQ